MWEMIRSSWWWLSILCCENVENRKRSRTHIVIPWTHSILVTTDSKRDSLFSYSSTFTSLFINPFSHVQSERCSEATCAKRAARKKVTETRNHFIDLSYIEYRKERTGEAKVSRTATTGGGRGTELSAEVPRPRFRSLVVVTNSKRAAWIGIRQGLWGIAPGRLCTSHGGGKATSGWRRDAISLGERIGYGLAGEGKIGILISVKETPRNCRRRREETEGGGDDERDEVEHPEFHHANGDEHPSPSVWI